MSAAPPPRPRARHARGGQEARQLLFLVFGGGADQPWLRLLRPGFRHCFAAIRDAQGWTVLDPLSGRLLVQRLDVAPDFDLPGFYLRAGLALRGPFRPGPPAPRWLPPLSPYSCVTLCRALLGSGAPFALTPHGLYRALRDPSTKLGKKS